MTTITFYEPQIKATYQQILDALVKNGFEHIRGSWFQYSDGSQEDFSQEKLVVGGCILGQGSLNLGANYSDVETALNEIRVPFSEIPAGIRSRFTQSGEGGRRSTGLGSILIEMNDHTHWKDKGNDSVSRTYTYSWKQMINYAKTHMKGHLEETVQLSKQTYNIKLPEVK